MSKRLERAKRILRKIRRRGRSTCCGALICKDANDGKLFCSECCRSVA